VAGRLPLRLRGPFLIELAAAFAGHEGEGLRGIAVEAAKRVVKIEAAENRATSARAPEAGGTLARLAGRGDPVRPKFGPWPRPARSRKSPFVPSHFWKRYLHNNMGATGRDGGYAKIAPHFATRPDAPQ
jgi:hypothetical protein